jgi:capsular exopolysaccharide synthesis family protein
VTTTQYVRVFRRFWRLIAVCAAVGLVVAVLVGALTSTTYTSSTGILVSSIVKNNTSASEAYSSTLLAQERMATYAVLAQGPTLAKEILDDSDIDLSESEVEDRLDVVVPASSTAMTIVVRDTDAHRAQQLASEAGDAMVKIIDRYEAARGPGRALLEARVTATAGKATSASSPPFWRNPLLGLMAGLIVGLGIAVAVARLDPRLRDESEAADELEAPVLGVLPMQRRRLDHTPWSPDRTWEEAVRELRTNLYFRHPGGGTCLTFALTSPHPVDQLPTISDALAAALVDTGSRVLVIEADLHEPHEEVVFDQYVDAQPSGLTSYLEGTSTEEDVIRHDADSGVDVLPSGVAPPHAADLLHSQALATLLENVAQRYDFVLVSAPATTEGTGAAAVAARCDGVLLAVVLGRTRDGQLREAMTQMLRVNVPLLGGVLIS